MHSFAIEITDLAESDLENAGDYIAYKLCNPKAAVDTVNGIRDTIHSIASNPYKNSLDDDPVLADIGVRMDYYRNYKIYYMIDDSKSTVYVVRILHMRVDSRVWLYRTFNLKL